MSLTDKADTDVAKAPNCLSIWKQGRQGAGLWRSLGRVESGDAADLSSNDYLGLARNPALLRRLESVSKELPMGSGGSRLLGGNHLEHLKLEQMFCRWKAAPAALCFPSGFQANLSVFQTVAKIFTKSACSEKTGPLVFSDARNHASMIDGMRLARLEVEVYAHLDMDDLERKLQKAKLDHPNRSLVIATETVFSMTGLMVPASIGDIAKKHNAVLVADEAHSIGVLGENAEGMFLHADNLILVHPCGKALASAGAVVTASKAFIEALLQEGRGFVYSTGLSPWLARGIQVAAEWIREHKGFRLGFLQELKSVFGIDHPILPVAMGSNHRAQVAVEYLSKQGWDAYSIRYPTVPKGKELLRLSLNPFIDLKKLQKNLAETNSFLKNQGL